MTTEEARVASIRLALGVTVVAHMTMLSASPTQLSRVDGDVAATVTASLEPEIKADFSPHP
jgi:hypothetical protein